MDYQYSKEGLTWIKKHADLIDMGEAAMLQACINARLPQKEDVFTFMVDPRGFGSSLEEIINDAIENGYYTWEHIDEFNKDPFDDLGFQIMWMYTQPNTIGMSREEAEAQILNIIVNRGDYTIAGNPWNIDPSFPCIANQAEGIFEGNWEARKDLYVPIESNETKIIACNTGTVKRFPKGISAIRFPGNAIGGEADDAEIKNTQIPMFISLENLWEILADYGHINSPCCIPRDIVDKYGFGVIDDIEAFSKYSFK